MRLTILIVLFAILTFGCKTPFSGSKTINLAPIESIPTLPFIVVNKNPKMISAQDLETHLSKFAKVEWLAEDSIYFLPTKQNMDTIITYLDDVFRKFGIHYIPEGLDCDDFARTKTAISKLIVSQAYQMEASPAIFTIFVFQKKVWANIPSGGGHALIAYACTDESGKAKAYVWEPQSSETIAITDYPNKDQIFYVGNEMTENPSTEPPPTELPSMENPFSEKMP